MVDGNKVVGGNQYVVVSSNSSLAEAEDIKQFISHHVSNNRYLGSASYTYEDIKYVYNVYTEEDKIISEFLNKFNCGIGFQNVFWIFLLTPIAQSKQSTFKHCDEQIWLRVGKIIQQLNSRAAIYKNQISFWVKKDTLFTESELVPGETIRVYGSDFEAFRGYVDSAEKKTDQLRGNTLYTQHDKKITLTIPTNSVINTLNENFNDNSSILKQFIINPYINALETQQISCDGIKTIEGKVIKIVVRANLFVEIILPEDGESGGT